MKSFRLISALAGFILLAFALAVPASAQTGPEPTGPAAAALSPDATPVSLDPFSTGPSYDSGWRSIAADQTLNLWHGLGLPPALMLVQLETRKYGSSAGIGQRFTGGNDLGTQSGGFGSPEARVGAYWHNLSSSYIMVTRMPEDTLLDAVRLRIWEMSSSADYSTGWVTVTPGHSDIFTHNLGGSEDDYVVDMVFNDTNNGGLGVNQRAYGGRTLGLLSTPFFNGTRVGAYWYGLQGNVIYVYRLADDEYADQILVRIWKREKPTYDSGWTSIGAGSTSLFTHAIGGSAEDYRVDMEFKTSPPLLINQCFYGGNDNGPQQSNFLSAADNDREGAYWYGLTPQSITVFRRNEDPCAEQVRIRIWNFWTPTQPDIDSGWRSVIPDTFSGFVPNLTGSLDDYLVDLQFKDSGLLSIGMHQRGLGGMDWVSGSTVTRIGGYWYFGSGAMLLMRRTEDADAPTMRARLWRMPRPAFDSGWHDISSVSALWFNHGLGGNPADYLVDLEFKDSPGNPHLMGYGGYDAVYIDSHLGDRLGGYWSGLTDSAITVTRRPEDTYIKYARVRIWTLARPDYDSGMAATLTGVTTFTHNLGSSPENYLLNLAFNNTSGSQALNQMYYGGNVFSSQPPAGHVAGDQVGGFWRDLRNTNVDFFRQFDDSWIDAVRLRIWQPKLKTFLPAVKR